MSEPRLATCGFCRQVKTMKSGDKAWRCGCKDNPQLIIDRYQKALKEICKTTISNRVEWCKDPEEMIRIAKQALQEIEND